MKIAFLFADTLLVCDAVFTCAGHHNIRGWPLMIWGGPEEESKMDLFFTRKCLSRIIFSRRRPPEIYFFLEKAFWDLFFSREGFWNLFFPGGGFNFFSLYEQIKKFNFYAEMPFKNYLFLDKASYFPVEDILRFIFFWRRASRFLGSGIPPGPPPDH